MSKPRPPKVWVRGPPGSKPRVPPKPKPIPTDAGPDFLYKLIAGELPHWRHEMLTAVAGDPELSKRLWRQVRLLEELGASWHMALAVASSELHNEAVGTGKLPLLPPDLCGCVSCRAGCRPERCEHREPGADAA